MIRAVMRSCGRRAHAVRSTRRAARSRRRTRTNPPIGNPSPAHARPIQTVHGTRGSNPRPRRGPRATGAGAAAGTGARRARGTRAAGGPARSAARAPARTRRGAGAARGAAGAGPSGAARGRRPPAGGSSGIAGRRAAEQVERVEVAAGRGLASPEVHVRARLARVARRADRAEPRAAREHRPRANGDRAELLLRRDERPAADAHGRPAARDATREAHPSRRTRCAPASRARRRDRRRGASRRRTDHAPRANARRTAPSTGACHAARAAGAIEQASSASSSEQEKQEAGRTIAARARPYVRIAPRSGPGARVSLRSRAPIGTNAAGPQRSSTTSSYGLRSARSIHSDADSRSGSRGVTG